MVRRWKDRQGWNGRRPNPFADAVHHLYWAQGASWHRAGRAIATAIVDAAYTRIGKSLQVLVRDNNVDQALRVLKKKMQREGIFREMKQRRAYEKPSERRTREKAQAIRRARKAARKQAQREGLLPAPKPRERVAPGGARPRA